MPKVSKILIPIFLTTLIIVVFSVFYVFNARDRKNIVFADETPDLDKESVYICPQATNLEEISPLCPGIVVLKLGETINGLTLSVTNYEGQEYYVVIGFKNGGGGKFGVVEKSIEDINNYIQALPEGTFKDNPQQRKNALKNKLMEVFIKIENNEYQDATNKLQNDIRTKADGFVSGSKTDDWIINPEAQNKIYTMIDNLIVYLKGL